MIENKKISVVIPVYNIGNKITQLISKIPGFVDLVIVIDDDCPLNTGKILEQHKSKFDKLKVLYNQKNLGVGGAVKKGYVESLKNNIDIVVKLDGDGQMDPSEIKKIINPLIGNYGYSKGNRFLEQNPIPNYPASRFYGNIFLSFMSKLSSGYWNIYDPINGFTAIKCEILKKINLDKIDNKYFFESDMLFHLYFLRVKIKDVPVKIICFKDQIQNLNVFKETFNFFFKNISRTLTRIKKTYLSNNFTIGSFFLIFSILFSLFFIFYGGTSWYKFSITLNDYAPTGVVMFSSISLLLGIIFFAAFLIIDSNNNPNRQN